MNLNKKLANIVVCVFALSACGGGVVKEVPPKPDVSGKYIFYLHGSAEESEGANEKYKSAVNAVASSSAIVVSEVRGDTDPVTYAKKIKEQVDKLVSKGVPPKNITISGFSKGAIIALASAGIIENEDVNYVLLAGCSDDLNSKYGVDPAKAIGRILSIYDADDEKFGSCYGIISESDKVKFKEIELESGKGHKLFRIPKEKFIEQWRDPLVEWAGA